MCACCRAQVQKIRLLLRERGLGAVRVGTVDDYQGQEERIILISTACPAPLPALCCSKHLRTAALLQCFGSSEGLLQDRQRQAQHLCVVHVLASGFKNCYSWRSC